MAISMLVNTAQHLPVARLCSHSMITLSLVTVTSAFSTLDPMRWLFTTSVESDSAPMWSFPRPPIPSLSPLSPTTKLIAVVPQLTLPSPPSKTCTVWFCAASMMGPIVSSSSSTISLDQMPSRTTATSSIPSLALLYRIANPLVNGFWRQQHCFGLAAISHLSYPSTFFPCLPVYCIIFLSVSLASQVTSYLPSDCVVSLILG